MSGSSGRLAEAVHCRSDVTDFRGAEAQRHGKSELRRQSGANSAEDFADGGHAGQDWDGVFGDAAGGVPALMGTEDSVRSQGAVVKRAWEKLC